MLKLFRKLLPILILFSFTVQIPTTFGIINEQFSTSEIKLSPNSHLLITEVNFKNTDADFLILKYYSPNQTQLNLQGLSIKTDTKIKIFDTPSFINNQDYFKITLNSTKADDLSSRQLYSKTKGLTGTTEQIMIVDQSDRILDAVCWSNSKVTAKELKDLSILHTNSGWNSSDPQSCIQSDTIKPNQSIIRINDGNSIPKDSNSSVDWKLKEVATPSIVAIDKPKTKSPTAKASVQPIIKNGDFSSKIIISEIMPNPEKNAADGEWIELSNTGSSEEAVN